MEFRPATQKGTTQQGLAIREDYDLIEFLATHTLSLFPHRHAVQGEVSQKHQCQISLYINMEDFKIPLYRDPAVKS